MLNKKVNKNSSGFTIIETIVSIAIFAIVSIAIFNLFNVVIRNIKNNKAMMVANNIALEQMEIVRGMDFDNVKTDVGWVPAGPIPNVKYSREGGIDFTIVTDITWVDDPFDGEGSYDTFPYDYKEVRVTVLWKNPITLQDENIAMNTNIVPPGLEGLGEGKGGIYVVVFDSQGLPVSLADVSISSDDASYTLLGAQTDSNGNLWIPDLEEASDYHIEVTKAGYSSSQTYAVNNDSSSADYNPIPEKTDVNVIEQKAAKIGFEIDVLSSLNIKTVHFINPDNVDVNSYLSGDQTNPSSVISSSDNIFVAWEDDRDGDSKIYLQKFYYSGGAYYRSWASDVLLKDTIGCGNPELEITSGGSLYLAWNDQRNGDSDIYIQQINVSDGSLLGAEYKVNEDSIFDQQNPDIGSDQSGDLYVVWEDNRNGDWDVFLQKFDVGTSLLWASDLEVNISSVGEQISPEVILDRSVGSLGENQNNIYVVWQDNSSGDFDIMMKKIYLDGTTVFEDIIINEDGALLDQYDPVISFDGSDYFYVAWSDDRNSQSDIYLQKVDLDGNIIFSNDVKVNDDSFSSAIRLSPSISYFSDVAIYVTWKDNRNGEAYNNIYSIKLNSDGGRLWTYDLVLSDTLESLQNDSFVVCDSYGNAVTVWSDDKRGDYDVFLARFSQLGNVDNGNIPITVTSLKSKGSYPNPAGDPVFISIPKYSETFYSDGSGDISIGSIEWGSYEFSTSSPYVIKSFDLPSPISINPGEVGNVVINIEN